MTVPTDQTALLEAARAWAAEDPDEQTRAELEALVAAAERGEETDLADRFAGTLEFGTAGLRGALGAGPNRMNRVVVTRAAAGLAAYLRDTGHKGGSVVIGFDARHNSDVFARDTAEIMTGAGFKALVMPRTLPTPLLAFAIRELGCAAGVMVTASHNPPQDNGYKVYLGDGSQIVPPADSEIAARIAAVGPLAELPRGDAGRLVGEEIVDRYLDTVAGLAEDGPRDLRIVYTPLHGVGGTTVAQVLETAGFDAPHVVEQQEHPDPDFPTVSFPNPEEPGAMDLAMALAARAHRPTWWSPTTPTPTAAPSRCPTSTAGGCCAATRWAPCWPTTCSPAGGTGTYANSIVSSSLLGKMAAAAGQPHEETLTGFKWIGRVEGLAFGYEEALGYCCDPEHVRDKDGVSALLLVCELAAQAKAEGRGLTDFLDDIARRARPARHRPAVGALRRPRRHPGDDGPAAQRSADHARRPRGRAGRGPLRGVGRAAADRRAALLPRRGRPRDRASQRHRAQGQVLPRGRDPGGDGVRRGRRGRRPDLRRGPARRDQGRPAGRGLRGLTCAPRHRSSSPSPPACSPRRPPRRRTPTRVRARGASGPTAS